MCRFILGVLVVISLFCGIWTYLGEDAFMWALILGLVIPGLGLILLPKRGVQHAYRNLYRKVAIIIVLGVGILGMAGLYVLAQILPSDASDLAIYAGLGFIGMAIIGLSFLMAYATVVPPTRRRDWLKKHFPEVIKAIKRYMQKGDLLEDYTPILRIGGKRYFLIYYHDKGNVDVLRGILLLDEKGRRVKDEKMLRLAAKCKHLALKTIDFSKSQRRAALVDSWAQTMPGLRTTFEWLRKNGQQIEAISEQARSDLGVLLEGQDDLFTLMTLNRDANLLEAQWAKDHGLGRLTEVAVEDVLDLEKRLLELTQPIVQMAQRIRELEQPAERLAKVLTELPAVPQRKMMVEALLGIADGARTVYGWVEKREYGWIDEEHLKAYRARNTYADQVDARLRRAEARV